MSQPPGTPEALPADDTSDDAVMGRFAASVADAPRDNWVDRYAPQPLRPYLRLSRADRPIGTWLLFIPCLWGLTLAVLAGRFYSNDLWLAASCGIGAFLMRGAGCTWNDLADRNYDAQVARTRSRPLPSGQVTPLQAGIWMAVQMAAAALILFSFYSLAVYLGLASLVLVAIYPFAKRFTWWPQVFLGLAFNWGALLAWAAHSGTLPVGAFFLYAGGIAWTLFYDTIYAHQDSEDDALIGIKSTARLFGAQTSRWLVAFLLVAEVCLMLAVLTTIPQGNNGLSLFVALAGVWAFGWHLHHQIRHLDISDPENCLKTFRSNRDAGLMLWLFLALAAVL